MREFFVWTDGGARGNPGPGAIGAVIKDEDGKILHTISSAIGETTNNIAEYKALIAALEWFKSHEFKQPVIHFHLDAELIIEQVSGRYKIKNEGLKPLYSQVRENIMQLGAQVDFTAIPRYQNKEADKLVNQALDKKLKR